jgi:sulfite reductase (NADPH) flavoprotein alpha-component
MQIIAMLGASHMTEVRGKTIARGAASTDLAVAGARLAVRADVVHPGGALRDKALALAQGEDPDGDAAISTCWPRCRNFAGIRPASRGLRRGAGAAAAAALLDLVVAQGRRPAACR